MVEEENRIPLLTDIVAPETKLGPEEELITIARLLGDLEAIVDELSDTVANRLRHNIREELRAELARILSELLEKRSRKVGLEPGRTRSP